MPSQNIKVLADVVSLEELCNEVAKLQKILRYLLDGNLDFENVRVGGLTAETIDVDQLSAISANLGTITAGLMQAVTILASSIYGSYIATANGTYPRYDIDSTTNQAAAWFDANNWIKMLANASGTPLVQLSASSGALTGSIGLDAPNNQLKIVSNKSINLVSGSGSVIVPSWSVFYNNSSGQNLQTVLNGKANSFSGFTGTIYVATSSGGSPTTAKTFNNGVCTS